MLGRFPGTPFLRKAEISRAPVSRFWGDHKTPPELTRSDPLIHIQKKGGIPDVQHLEERRLERTHVPLHDPHFEGDEPAGL
jgi:hypothetical protein